VVGIASRESCTGAGDGGLTVRRLGQLAFLLLLTAGCYKYSVRPVPSPAPVSSFRASKARITLRDGRLIRMEQVYVRGDSLRTDRPFSNSPAAVSLADVDQLQVGEFSTGRTLRWTVIVGGTALLALIFFAMATDPS